MCTHAHEYMWCAHVCVQVHLPLCEHTEARGWSLVLFSIPVHLALWRASLSVNLELGILAREAGQGALRIHLPLPP